MSLLYLASHYFYLLPFPNFPCFSPVVSDCKSSDSNSTELSKSPTKKSTHYVASSLHSAIQTRTPYVIVLSATSYAIMGMCRSETTNCAKSVIHSKDHTHHAHVSFLWYIIANNFLCSPAIITVRSSKPMLIKFGAFALIADSYFLHRSMNLHQLFEMHFAKLTSANHTRSNPQTSKQHSHPRFELALNKTEYSFCDAIAR